MSIHAQGLRAWIWQRLTAVYISVFLVVALVWFCSVEVISFTAWRELVAHPVVNISIALFFVSILLHAGVGVRDVIVDYAHPLVLRFVLLVALSISIIVVGIWMLMILISVVAL